MTSSQTKRLIIKAQSGDKRAFEKLIKARRKNIVYIALSILKDQHDAEDAAQDAIESMYNHLGNLKTPEAFEAWMYRIVFRACLKIQEGGKKQRATDIEEISSMGIVEERAELLPYESNEKAEMRRLLLSRIKELPDNYRNSLFLFYFEDMSYEEIAESLDVSIKDVSNWLDRGKKKLKAEISVEEMQARNPAAAEASLIASAFALDMKNVLSDDNIVSEGLKKILLLGTAASGAGGVFMLTTGKVVSIASLLIAIGIGGLAYEETSVEETSATVIVDEAQSDSGSTASRKPSNDAAITDDNESHESENQPSPSQATTDSAPSAPNSSENSSGGSGTNAGEARMGDTIYTETPQGIIIENEVFYGPVNPDDPNNFDTEKDPDYVSNKVDIYVESGKTQAPYLIKTGDYVWIAVIVGGVLALISAIVLAISKRKKK